MADDFDNVINLEGIRKILDALLPMPSTLEDNEEDSDDTRSPPVVTPAMFPGMLQPIVDACTQCSEAVPVSVAINILIRVSALVGPTIYLPIGDEKRLLNEFVLMVGPSGLGKGASNHGPKRIFKRVEEYLALDLDNPDIHHPNQE
ncbi:hypothetical protein [Endozoicomonas sp. 4G]|uniref:hypothetical protein n=1 Tax=Endozoicomonas sp. 4G TaxID=2872754 RepID=UPI0020789CA3|nr:hypothetical protein [Endozoicomonas sp. 4G]